MLVIGDKDRFYIALNLLEDYKRESDIIVDMAQKLSDKIERIQEELFSLVEDMDA